MAKVYDKDGKEYEVLHQIDVAEWLVAGFTVENPKEAKKPKAKEAE